MKASSSGSEGSAKRVWTLLRSVVEHNKRSSSLQTALGLGLGIGRVKVLMQLMNGPMTLRELADKHAIDAPYATVIIDKLVGLGYVERTPHPEDRRCRLVCLTSAGRKAAAISRDVLDAPPESFSALSATELRQLEFLLSKLV